MRRAVSIRMHAFFKTYPSHQHESHWLFCSTFDTPTQRALSSRTAEKRGISEKIRQVGSAVADTCRTVYMVWISGNDIQIAVETADGQLHVFLVAGLSRMNPNCSEYRLMVEVCVENGNSGFPFYYPLEISWEWEWAWCGSKFS